MSQPYLTEERLRVLGFVGDLGDLEDVEIQSILLIASARADDYCNVPRLPQPYSFRGGSITNEQHPWNIGNELVQPQRTIFLRHTPVKAVSSLRIYVTPSQYTEFDVDEIFIAPDMGTIDIVSLSMTSTGLFGAFIVPNIGLNKPQVRISYTYGYEFTAEDETLQPTDAKYYRAQNQFWDDTAVVVKIDGVEQNSSDYDIDRIEGAITLHAAPAAGAVVTASYGYTLPTDIALATGIIAHDILTERELHDKGLGNVRSLRVGEIQIDRGRTVQDPPLVPPEAQAHLNPYRFMSAGA